MHAVNMDVDEHKYRPKSASSHRQGLILLLVALFLLGGFLVRNEFSQVDPVTDPPLQTLGDDQLIEHKPPRTKKKFSQPQPSTTPPAQKDDLGDAEDMIQTMKPSDSDVKLKEAEKEIARLSKLLEKSESDLRSARQKMNDNAKPKKKNQGNGGEQTDTTNKKKSSKKDSSDEDNTKQNNDNENINDNNNNNDNNNDDNDNNNDDNNNNDSGNEKQEQRKDKNPSHMHGPVKATKYNVKGHSRQPLDDATKERQDAVREAMKHAWKGYKADAWGQDELLPISHSSSGGYGMGMTIIDSLDTLYIMGLDDEFDYAADWIRDNLHIETVSVTVSVFETFIRCVGGLLSAYELSARPFFLEKAHQLVDVLKAAFDTQTGIPHSTLNMQSKSGSNYGWTGGHAVTAEGGTVQLEMRALSRFTGNDEYAEIGDRTFMALDGAPGKVAGGLYPIHISTVTNKFTTQQINIGAMGDSFYEYMLKGYLQTNKTDPRYLKMYLESAEAILEKLVQTTDDGLTYIAEMNNNHLSHTMEHLTCFAGGMFALGAAYIPENVDKHKHVHLAKELTRTCYEGYKRMATGLAPDAWSFKTGKLEADTRRYNILRPETIESIFYLYRLTGDKKYQDWGWEMFQSFEKVSRVESGGYTGINDVTRMPPDPNNKMESFFLAETLKYFYLLFSPTDLISFNDFVFNTEAHPLRRFTP